jgi:hypothetical protein
MGEIISLVLAGGLLFLAYRIIRNGFIHPQSKRLNGFGILGCVLLVLVAVTLIGRLF